ncbi:MAG: hypothetical protein IJS82_03085 [Paludibacteraceae bacterium]|nr:hypothetical protein [Paludibacteraceae bacterium]
MAIRYYKFSIIGLVVLLVSCQFRQDTFVDFTDKETAKGLKFQVIGQHETDLSQGLPSSCYMPDGTPANEYSEASNQDSDVTGAHKAPKTSSVTGTAVLQELLKYGNQNNVIEIVGTYPSINTDGDSVILSGKVMLPKNGNPKRMILVSHYTVCSNAEAPSNCFSLEGVLVKLGYGLIIPDYIGYGITANEVHPYLVMDLTARNVLDMYLAVRPWLDAVGRVPDDSKLDLMGYSQGGATTMAVQYLIETEYDDPEEEDYVSLHRVFAGGGPYDVKATYERFVTTDTAGYPVAVPLVLQGMIKGNNLSIRMEDLMQEWLYNEMDNWINSKRYTSAQINKLIGTKVTHKILTPEGMDQTSEKVAELYKAMTVNSIISYNWIPEASVYIMHSMDDETVPYANASNAKAKWKEANITYNFGHYGGHVMTALRFIYSVQTLLVQEEEERKKYEN